MKLSPLLKGIITAVAMIGTTLATFYILPENSPFHFLVFAVYGLGIIWTLLAWKNSPDFSGKFGESFNIGFRCFVVATLLMAIYTFVFNKMHPEFADEAVRFYKEQQLKANNNMPSEIESAATRYKNGYTMTKVYGSIFGYLIIGSFVTALGSLIITRRK